MLRTGLLDPSTASLLASLVTDCSTGYSARNRLRLYALRGDVALPQIWKNLDTSAQGNVPWSQSEPNRRLRRAAPWPARCTSARQWSICCRHSCGAGNQRSHLGGGLTKDAVYIDRLQIGGAQVLFQMSGAGRICRICGCYIRCLGHAAVGTRDSGKSAPDAPPPREPDKGPTGRPVVPAGCGHLLGGCGCHRLSSGVRRWGFGGC